MDNQNYREAEDNETKCIDCINTRPPKWRGEKLICRSPITTRLDKVDRNMTCDYASE